MPVSGSVENLRAPLAPNRGRAAQGSLRAELGSAARPNAPRALVARRLRSGVVAGAS
jgi:hypothetical protein